MSTLGDKEFGEELRRRVTSECAACGKVAHAAMFSVLMIERVWHVNGLCEKCTLGSIYVIATVPVSPPDPSKMS